MRALLMHRDRDFDPQAPDPPQAKELVQDLELDVLLDTMAGADPFVRDVTRKALLNGTANDIETILYRQGVLDDCLQNPTVIRDLYKLAIDGVETKKGRFFSSFSKYPASVLLDSREVLKLLTVKLRQLRTMVESHGHQFRSVGFGTLFATIRTELAEEYLISIEDDLRRVEFENGTPFSARIGPANRTSGYVLRKRDENESTWIDRLLGRGPRTYTYHLAERDEVGARILSDMYGRAINRIANVLAQSADHVLSFFDVLRTELAFYVGCLNLRDKLGSFEAPVVLPRPEPTGSRRHSADGLYDVCLSLKMQRRIVDNSFRGDDKILTIITGANQGGKSSFLRSLGLAQLMMQAGMFVGAEAFFAELVHGVYAHYKREEDTTMRSGKLDEELIRLSTLADMVQRDSLVLFNESFSSTNEREGSEISRQVVHALIEAGIKVAFVTHQFDFAHGIANERRADTTFLRAERRPDGTRPFKLVEAEPLQTSYGEDLYRAVFGGRRAELDRTGQQPSPPGPGADLQAAHGDH